MEWLTAIGGDADKEYTAFLKTIDTIIMGGNTYRQIISWNIPWLYEGIKTHVFTSQAMPASKEVSFESGNLKGQNGKSIWLLGGTDIARQCLGEGLIDELNLAIMPILLGEGVSLFQGTRLQGLRLIESSSHGSVQSLYYQIQTKP